ncbi:hypothetical protein KIPE111705_46370 [Kibdelosporangium persicum]|uniref:Uncharacterized protein n=1 Tax=Kibdelosporangium persicum TaxID=2698649 RepID=A0ABX2F4G3_9PSEU|nr:hypothetical protein [Kibdelosporangium persicum]NRN65743.1 hypothetical protein [Kibdelosporangium persicum]
MTPSITEHDQDAGASSRRYHYTGVVEIAGHTVRARVVRGFYGKDSGAVAEVLTDQAEWISLAADALNNWWHDTPPPSPDVHAATVLGPLAERLLRRAAKILAAPQTMVTFSPHIYQAVSALLATSSGFNGECHIDPDDIAWATSHGGALHIFEHPDGSVTFTKAHRDECPFVASKGSQDCDDECYFDLPQRS